MTPPLKALIVDGRVHELGPFTAYAPGLDVRDVSGVPGIAVGWAVDAVGNFAPPVVAPPSVQDLVAYARAKRYAVEVGGIVVAGVPIATDDRSKALLTGARLRAQADSTLTESVAALDGSTHVLSAAQVIAISDAIGAHVSNCFKVQAAVIQGISSTPPTITTFAGVEAAAWPANG